jgi:subtilisin family serine protease
MDAAVIRRFELWVGEPGAVEPAADAVDAAVATAAGRVTRDVTRVTRPPMLEVRLEGAAHAVASVVERLKTVPGARLRRDVTRVRRDRGGLPYPDRRSRVRVKADAVATGVAGEPVTVAIVDSGLMVEHPAFRSGGPAQENGDHLWRGPGDVHGRAFIGDPYDIRDRDGHGTLVAGTVLATAAGAPVKLMTAKFFDPMTPARPDVAAKALRFAVEHEAKIIVCAWDVGIGSTALQQAFAAACAGALVVIAAGNYGSDNDPDDRGRTLARAPARYAGDHRRRTLTVMATDEAGEKTWFSNYGVRTVDLGAPGTSIVSTRRFVTGDPSAGEAFRTHGGTSAAAAHVAGAAALLLSRYPRLELDEVKDCLMESVDTLPRLKCASQGRLDVAAALAAAAEKASQKP